MPESMHAELQSLAKRFAEKAPKVLPGDAPVWIFGAGPFGRDLCAALQVAGHTVAGFVETRPVASVVHGLPLLNWQQWSPAHNTASLCIGIFNRATPLDELQALAIRNGARNLFLPWDVYPAVRQSMGWRFWLSEPERILSQLERLDEALNCLSDEASKRCLLDIASFRLGLGTQYASFRHPENQYFNPLTLAALQNRPIRYVDGGAYNGDTYLELCGLTDVEDAYLFEPDAANYSQLITNTPGDARRAQCLPLGLSDRYEILSFNAGNGEGASISATGTSHIAVTALDSVLGGRAVDFIKLDVEGAELQALLGAKVTIQRSRPVIALSLYHCPADLWSLPLSLAAMCEGYRFYIRQHYFNTFESVLYAVPSEH